MRFKVGVAAALSAAAASFAAACTIGEVGEGDLRQVAETGGHLTTSASSSKSPASVARPPLISVKDGASGVAPWDGVTVTSASRLLQVSMVNEQGREIDAKWNPDETEWVTDEPMGYGRTYTVTAKNAEGKTSTATFTTVAPAQQANVSVGPLDGSTVGIAQAITFRFGAPVKDTKAAEDAITVTTSNDTEGGFFWLDPYELRWRPKEFWEPGTEVTVSADVYGHDFGGGVWGGNDVEISFAIGDARETVVDNATKTLTVYENGEVLKSFPVALGRDGTYDTPNGTYVVGDKHEHLVMDSRSYGLGLGEGGYVTPVDWATQMSYSGIYVHSAPWAAGDLGRNNVSHGCVNASPENAKWFQETVRRGDPVIVRNTSGAVLTPYDGLGYWNLDWEQRSGGSDTPLYE